MRGRIRLVSLAVAVVVGGAWVLRADDTIDAALQLQLASLLSDETRYREAIDAYDKVLASSDPALVLPARKGKIRAALRIGEFGLAKTEATVLRGAAPRDADVLALYGDAVWSNGLFDDADAAYHDALAISPSASRARFGAARSLAATSHLAEALDAALAASAASPGDGEIYALVAEIEERLKRFDEAAIAYTNYINLLPNKDRSEKAEWSRAKVTFLESFRGIKPVDMDQDDLQMLHTLPFRLVDDKIVVQGRVDGGKPQDFVLDTGSEETVISRETAQRAHVRPVAYTLSAGVGEVGLRGLQLGQIKSLDLGTLQVRNLPVLIKNPALRGIPKREGESFSPLSLGMSMMIDYQKRLLTIGKALPTGAADFRLPLRVHRLAMVRGLLNSDHPTYFVVDTGGEVISISADTARSLPASRFRRIPLKVWGTSGWDRDAFLLPGADLDFDRIEYRNFPLVVLNLRAPSLLLGFQLGGIVGHKFLSPYRVSMDLEQSELRLEKF